VTSGRRKVAVVHPRINIGGGSEAVALWTVEALMDLYDMTLMTMSSETEDILDRWNDFYGTHLSAEKVRLIRFPLPRWLARTGDALRTARFARLCRSRAVRYDAMISAYNVMDFGRPGIQMIADFSFSDELRRRVAPKPERGRFALYANSPFRRLYMAAARRHAGISDEGWKANRTIANSRWTAEMMQSWFGVESTVLYPPIGLPSRESPWSGRQDGFVCLGRLEPEKNIHGLIGILDHVRARGYDVHVHILGSSARGSYRRELAALGRERRSWVFLEGIRHGAEKDEILGSHRFGLHGAANEAFGIAVAELVAAGCLVWVPGGGGQVEIVPEESLIYDSEEDAIRKIIRLLDSPEEAARIRGRLRGHIRQFARENFVRGIRRIVSDFFDRPS